MQVPMPPLHALRVFEASARLRSFKKASEELFVTPSAVSQQIKSLEDNLGVILFNRAANGIVVTPEGQKLLPVLERVFAQINDAVTDLRAGNKLPLRISTPPSLASNWLAKRLSNFEEEFPNIVTNLHSSLDKVNLVQDGFDCLIRVFPSGAANEGLESLAQQNMQYEFLFAPELFCVANPNRLRNLSGKNSMPNSPNDLPQYNLLHYRDYTNWTMWSLIHEVSPLNTNAGIVCNSVENLCRNIMEGEGVALVDRIILDHPEYGEYMRSLFANVEKKYDSNKLEYYFIAPAQTWDKEPIRQFRHWLIQNVQTIQGHFSFAE